MNSGRGRESVRGPGRRLRRPLSRGSADGRGGRRQVAAPAPQAGVAGRYAASDTALRRSARIVARPTVPTILLPGQITVKGAPAARRCFAPQTLEQ